MPVGKKENWFILKETIICTRLTNASKRTNENKTLSEEENCIYFQESKFKKFIADYMPNVKKHPLNIV